jgi:hypothetical protein
VTLQNAKENAYMAGVLTFKALFGNIKKLAYSLCLIVYKLMFGNSFSERAYSLFY